MRFEDYQADLKSTTFELNRVLDKYFHCGQSAVFENEPPEAEPDFKGSIAKGLYGVMSMSLHPLQFVICGSAHLGFSPAPSKLGKLFDGKKSDIDVAVVSAELFDRWWRELQLSKIDPDTRATIANDLFRGFINPQVTGSITQVGRDWWSLFGRLRTPYAVAVRGRLYRDFWSMQGYHRKAVLAGRDQLLGVRR